MIVHEIILAKFFVVFLKKQNKTDTAGLNVLAVVDFFSLLAPNS